MRKTCVLTKLLLILFIGISSTMTIYAESDEILEESLIEGSVEVINEEIEEQKNEELENNSEIFELESEIMVNPTIEEEVEEISNDEIDQLFSFASLQNTLQKDETGDLYNKAVDVIENMRSVYDGEEVVQTGVTKATYVDTIAKCLAEYSKINNLIELEDYTKLSSSMQSYSRVICSMAVLVNEGNVTKYVDYDSLLYADHNDFVDLYIKHMTNALNHMIDHAGKGLDFATFELCMAYVLTSNIVAEETTTYWKGKLGEIKGTYFTDDPDGWYNISCQSQDNRASYVDGAEQIREYLGLIDAEDYIDTSLSKINKKFTTNGMFRDSNSKAKQNPFLYDYTVRAHFSVVDFFGYGGEYSDQLKTWLRKGGLTTLLLQSTNGEIPYGGRSNQYLFNETLLASSCEYEANYYKSIGDEYLAGVFKRSAHIAIESIQDYLNEGKHIKNMMSSNDYGIDDYGQYDKYMVSLSSFLAIGYFYADDSIEEEYCPAEVGGYVAHENELFNTIVASCGGYSIELLTTQIKHEDSIGLNRIVKDGIPASLGVSSSFAANPDYNIKTGLPEGITSSPETNWYSFDVAWKNQAGEIVKLSDFHAATVTEYALNSEVNIIEESKDKVVFSVKYFGENMDGVDAVIEKYTLTEEGLKIETELVNPVKDEILFTVPLLYENGDKENAIVPNKISDENKVTLTYKNYSYTVESNGNFVDDSEFKFNRNGIYSASHFEKDGNKIVVKASLEKNEPCFNVSATKEKIILSFENYDNNAKEANVYMVEPYEYHYLDNNTGYSTTTVLGQDELKSIGTIVMDGNKYVIEINRIENGVDLLYHKFYLADNNRVYAGPLWVTTIDDDKEEYFSKNIDSIKGTGSNVFETSANNEYRIGFTTSVNANSCKSDLLVSYIWSENDLSSGKTKYSPFVASNGNTYYYKNSGGTQNVGRLDNVINKNAENGIATTLIITFKPDSDKLEGLIPAAAKETGRTGLVAFDTSTAEGAGDLIALYEWIASTYGNKLDAIVLGNEIDFPNVWNYNYDFENNGMPDIEDYVEEYYRTLRLATLAVSRYVDDLPVLVPFTHYWSTHGNDEMPAELYNVDAEYSYATKDILDVLFEKTNSQGNFYWGIAPHPYAASLLTSDPIGFDSLYPELVTGELDSPLLTFENLEVLDEYLHQEDKLYNNEVRPVFLTESGIEANDGDHTQGNDADEEQQKKQAASIAYIYYKASLLDSIKRWPYLHTTDGSDIWGGFYVNGTSFKEYETATKRLSYNVWKDIDYISTKEFDEKYGSYISSLKLGEGIASYKELLIKVGENFGSHYDWEKLWNCNECKNSHDDEHIIYKEYLAPTDTEDGNIEYWYCPRCERYYLDAELTEEVEDVILPHGTKIGIANTGIKPGDTVYVDGVKVEVTSDDSIITLNNNPNVVTVYKQNKNTGDVHEVYPTSMNVYFISKNKTGGLLLEENSDYADILKYSGASIRITGKKGIRIITSISTDKKNSLINSNFSGYKVMEYGTIMCWASDLIEGEEPTLTKDSIGSFTATHGAKGRAYSRNDKINSIYKESGGVTQYTNTLVGDYTKEQCASDVAMRSYIIIRPVSSTDASDDIAIYGGTIYRSISYVAYQNRNVFSPGTEAYEYIWNLIKFGYGDKYDSEYKKGQ